MQPAADPRARATCRWLASNVATKSGPSRSAGGDLVPRSWSDDPNSLISKWRVRANKTTPTSFLIDLRLALPSLVKPLCFLLFLLLFLLLFVLLSGSSLLLLLLLLHHHHFFLFHFALWTQLARRGAPPEHHLSTGRPRSDPLAPLPLPLPLRLLPSRALEGRPSDRRPHLVWSN